MGGENGTVIHGTPVAVDMWYVRKCPQARLFFLTHMHADHTKGLTSSWNLPIYCSPVSKDLLVYKFKIRKELICALEVGEGHVVYLDDQSKESMLVSVIDANHCPGAVMFLFQGYFGNILYTGDFRYREEMFVDTPLSDVDDIEVLYLDNTYCQPDCKFPTRIEALGKIISIIERHPDHCVLIGVRNLGKEDMLASIAKYFRTWVVVKPTYYESLQVLEMPNVFTDNPEAGYIFAWPFQRITKGLLAEWNQDKPTIGILPTALFAGMGGEPYANQDNIFLVPYSDHSSYEELHEFVSRVQPKTIIPIVNDSGSGSGMYSINTSVRSDMKCFSRYLNPSQRIDVTIPDSVEKFMYRKICVTSEQNKKLKRIPSKLPTQTYSKKPPARGVVFDTTLETNAADINCDRDETESGKPRKEKINALPSTSLTDQKWLSCKVSETVSVQPSTDNNVINKCEERRFNEISWHKGVTNSKKRKLPQTLLSALKRKPKVSILGLSTKNEAGRNYDYSSTPFSKNISVSSETKGACARIEKLSDVKDKKKDIPTGNVSVIEVSSDSDEDLMTKVTNKLHEVGKCKVIKERTIVKALDKIKNSPNDGKEKAMKDHEDSTLCSQEELKEISVWNNESLLSEGNHEDKDDEDCPFCSSHSDCEELDEANDKSPAVNINEIDLIEDLLEEQASSLSITF